MNRYCPIIDDDCVGTTCTFYDLYYKTCNYNGMLNYVAVIDNRDKIQLGGFCDDENGNDIPFRETPRFFALRADGHLMPIYFEGNSAWANDNLNSDNRYCDEGHGFFREIEPEEKR